MDLAVSGSFSLFDWNTISQLVVLGVMLMLLLVLMFLLKEAGANAAHRRNLEQMDKERYGRERKEGKTNEPAAEEKRPPVVD
jgi:uncharacterized membrane protein